MTQKPTIYITNLTTSERYKVVGVNKEAQTIDLLSLDSGTQSTEAMADFSGTNFKVEKVAEPEPITEQPGFHFGPHPIYDKPNEPEVSDQWESPSNPALVHEESETGLTASQADAPTQQDDAVVEQDTNVAQPALPVVTNRREAMALSEAYKAELKPVYERMRLVESEIGKGLKGEAKKIRYIVQWVEKYLDA